MTTEISLLDAESSERVFDELYELHAAAISVDRPGSPPRRRDDYVTWLRNASIGTSPIITRVARRDGRAAAVGYLQVDTEGNPTLAYVEIHVAPDLRRQGIGTDLLKAIVPAARALGRTRVVGPNITVGGAGDHGTAAWGFVPAMGFVIQALPVPEVDPGLWDVAVPDGYRIEKWIGAAPDGLLASVARARTAIADAPRGASSYESPEWTPERVRLEEEGAAARGVESRVVVAVHEETGEVAGLTEIWMLSPTTDRAMQRDTAVLAAHRGHGLGRSIKAAMMRQLVADHPQVIRVGTQTSTENPWMIAVNLQLGYQTLYTTVHAEIDLADLEKRLAAR